MTYQPKSYRKFLATSVAAAMVATVAAPMVLADFEDVAAAPMLLADFEDVAAGSYYSDAVDYLVEKGVLEGFPDGTFQPNTGVTRAQAAKILVEALGLEVSATVELGFTDTKDDVWYSGYVAALVEAGIVQGNPDGTFAPGATITRAELAKMVVVAYGLMQDDNVEIPFTDTVNGAWYEDYVNTLYSLGVVNGVTLTAFGPGETVSRAQSAVFVHRTEVEAVRLDVEKTVIEVSSVMAIGVKTVEVKFNGAVDTEKATVQIKKGAAIYSTDVKWNEAKDTATVTTVIALPAADYSAVVTGLTADALKFDFTVGAEVETTVSVTSVTVDDSDVASQVAFVVENQYGEDMEVVASTPGLTVSAFNVTQNATVTVSKPADQYFTIDTLTEADEFKVGDEIRFTTTYKGITTQAKVIVADPSSSAAIEFGDIVLAEDDTKLNVADGTVKLNYTLLDQYGKATDLSAIGATALPTTLNGVQFISSDTSVISHIAVVNDADGNGEIVLTVAGDGTAVITAVVNESGAVVKTTITVEENSAPDAVAIAAPTMLVASQDEAFNLGLTVTDQYGSVLTSAAGLTATMKDNGSIDNNAVLSLNDTDDVTTLNVDLSGLADGDVDETETVTIEITNDVTGDVVGTVSFDIEPEAIAQEVKAAKFAKVFEDTATFSVTADDLTVVDQYGRSFEGVITVTSSAAGVLSVANNVDLTANSVGNATLTVDVDGVTLDVAVKVIASSDVKSYTLSDLGTLYADPNADTSDASSTLYEAAVTLNGVDANGKTVVLDFNAPDVITTSNASVAAVSGTNVFGVSEGTATISAWKDGVIVASKTVTVSEAKPAATSIEFTASTITAAAGDVNLNTIIDVLDQYDVEITSTTALFFSGGSEVAATGVVTDADDAVDVVETITVITSNGLSVTNGVTIN